MAALRIGVGSEGKRQIQLMFRKQNQQNVGNEGSRRAESNSPVRAVGPLAQREFQAREETLPENK